MRAVSMSGAKVRRRQPQTRLRPARQEHQRMWSNFEVAQQGSDLAAKYVGRRRPDVGSYVVLVGDVPIGYAQYWHAGTTEGGIDLILDPRWRGRGFGPDAADALANHVLRNLHWTRVTADPAATNARAVRAWEKAGFRRVGQNGDEFLMDSTPSGRRGRMPR
ncbi:GNAT family protein [Dactylosporangium sp. AC04546]|uniref:GNAT family N-acetyltransferase n=1 Tax=Dactylosporangium sp. AC04546 TaxID=2862460 RepID=UPI001EE09F57|nr:GNAT family protein [Dactylosporangium sp. AC04546]WVK86384.1 GNAT family protein [Dactylosporangium sp. AC04546]